MNREVHVRICEGVGVKLPRATRLRTKTRNRHSPRQLKMHRDQPWPVKEWVLAYNL
jgi:hypothetical protein